MSSPLSRRQFLKVSLLGLGLAAACTAWPVAAAEASGGQARSEAVFKARPRQPVLALTFDDGLVNVARCLDACKSLGLRLTLFPIGKAIESHPEIWQRALAEGHELGCHTYSHKPLGGQPYAAIAAELDKCMQVAQTYLSLTSMPYLRPPYGSGWNWAPLQQAAGDYGMRLVMWNRTNDMDQFSAAPTWREVKTAFGLEARPGDIFLYHFRYQEVSALESIAELCAERGWHIGTVSQLLRAEQPAPAPSRPGCR